MAPIKASTKIPTTSRTLTTRSKTIAQQTKGTEDGKRKAECSPHKEPSHKRPALSDLTNDTTKLKDEINNKIKKPTTKNIPKAINNKNNKASIKTVNRQKNNENLAPPRAPVIGGGGIVTRASLKNTTTTTTNQTAAKPKEVTKEKINANKIKTRLSNEFDKTEESSLYTTASEETNATNNKGETLKKDDKNNVKTSAIVSVSMVAEQMNDILNLSVYETPDGVYDYDKENWDDVYQVSHYAMNIFNYLKSQESSFKIPNYMERQIVITPWMRSLLIDWMVEVQESFELNHETLYLGVKLLDIYLSRVNVSREALQLVGAVSMFIACKYDERIPPLIDDFLYICDGAYNRSELLRMEINILKVCEFNLGIPLSYRFLRRYARCAKVTMNVLTLARFVLEQSLMDYETITIRDSKLAAASLYIALKMKKVSGWTPVLEFYTGYKLSEIIDVVLLLNKSIQKKYKEKHPLMTIRNKYSHKTFFEVAKIPTLRNEELLA